MLMILALIVIPFVVSLLLFRKFPAQWDKHRNSAQLMFLASFLLGIIGFIASITFGVLWGPMFTAWMIYVFMIAGAFLFGGIAATKWAANRR